jgi:hypothetical protein
VFDKLKNLFGGASTSAPAPARPGNRPYRPAKPRTAGKRGAARQPKMPSPGSERAAAEISCPNCGAPMLAGWGSTCGKCRPNLVAPKTMFPGSLPPDFTARALAQAAQAAGMTLGWLVVIRSSEKDKLGSLIELDDAHNILSRGGAAVPGGKTIGFDDVYMSSGHATVSRPKTGERTEAFTIRDRGDPGPSANGTFVNSHKLAAGEVARISDGDVIKLGVTELLFKSLWLPAVPPSRSS